MSSSARIDELRKKFDENPRRFFAPLANEYRKAGDFEQAVFICQEYLPQQPGHMSGHIVYGQTLFDMGRDEEAKAVFETALTLDPENLIALKHLGDIARQAGDVEGARSWYQRVLEADPRNDEIMQVLESLGGADIERGPTGQPDALPSMYSAAPSDEFESTAGRDYDNVDLPPLTAEEPEDPADTSENAEPMVLEQSVSAALPEIEPEVVAFAASSDESIDELFSDVPSSGEQTPSDVLVSEATTHELLDLDDFAIGSSAPAEENSPESEPVSVPLHVGESMEFESLSADGLSDEAPVENIASEATSEPDIELATDVILGLTDDAPESPVEHVEEEVAEFESEPSHAVDENLSRAIDQLDGLETFSIDLPVDPPVAASNEGQPLDVPALDTPEPTPPDTFATETMADLYAQQGHLESAIEIYEQLIERSPDDAELRRRASEVERQLYGTPAAGALEAVNETVAADTETLDVEDRGAPVSSGPTIREFFRGILNGRISTEAADASLTEAAEPANDLPSHESEGSLDILFSDAATAEADQSAATSLAQAFGGDEERNDAAALHGTPAHLAKDELSLDHVFRSSTPARGSAAASGFSLDQFFAGDQGNVGGAETSSEGAPPQPSDDIAQFNAWLSGLKKT